MRRIAGVAMALLAAAAPRVAWAQGGGGGRVGVAVEVLGGWSFPVGEFRESGPGIGARPGPRVGALARVRLLGGLDAYGGYGRSWYGCEQCGGASALDGLVDSGAAAGLSITGAARGGGARFWVRTGLLVHRLVFSGRASAVRSDVAVGTQLGAGAALPVLTRSLVARAGVMFDSYTADLPLGEFPTQQASVRDLAPLLSLTYSF